MKDTSTAIETELKRFDEWQKVLERFRHESCPVCGITPKYLETHLNKIESQVKQSLIQQIGERLEAYKCEYIADKNYIDVDEVLTILEGLAR